MAIDTSQLPAGAQRASGNTKNPVGVLEEGMFTDGDILGRQAEMFARNRNLPAQVAWREGNTIPEEVLERVKAQPYNGMAQMNQDTINAVQQGTQQRDQAFIGNNANFTGYYLEEGAKYVIPLMTPFRNMLPRVPCVGIDTINWRAITDYFGGNGPSVATAALQQQSTPTSLQYVWVNQSNILKMLSVKDIVTFEAELYGKLFQGDVRATVAARLIPALMQEQEFWYINSGQRLWAPPQVYNVTTATTGGTITAATNWILVTAVNANGETLALGGTGATAISIVTTGSTSTVTFNIQRVPSATKYNVYVGTGGTQPAASAMWLQSATTQFGGASALNDPGGLAQGFITVTATAAWATSGTAYSTLASNTAIVVKSTDSNTLNLPLSFDGIQSLINLNQGTPNTIGVQGETPFLQTPASTNGALALSDIDIMLEKMFLNAHADPEYLFVSVKDHRKLSNLVAQGTNFRVTIPNQDNGLGMLVGGQRVTKYINQTTGRLMDVVMLPYLMQGTIIACSMTIPFPVTAIDKPPLRIEYNRDMWAVDYPPDQSHYSQWAFAAYTNETMVAQYLGGQAAITGISLS